MTPKELQEEIVAAMKAKDLDRRDALRLVKAEVANLEIANKTEATEDDVNTALKKVLKQTRETLAMSEKAGNDQERTDKLAAKVAALESCMPAMLSGDALREEIVMIISARGYSSMKDMGKVMGELKAKTCGAFDGAEASSIAKSLLG